MKYLVSGAGGFIGGHLVANLLEEGHEEGRCKTTVSIGFNYLKRAKFSLDLKDYSNCLKVADGVDYVYNMACNMGMGLSRIIKECMLSVLINTNLLRACVEKVKNIFSSSACVYNASKQEKTFIDGLKESDAYPAQPEWIWMGKISEECVDIFMKILD